MKYDYDSDGNKIPSSADEKIMLFKEGMIFFVMLLIMFAIWWFR